MYMYIHIHTHIEALFLFRSIDHCTIFDNYVHKLFRRNASLKKNDPEVLVRLEYYLQNITKKCLYFPFFSMLDASYLGDCFYTESN